MAVIATSPTCTVKLSAELYNDVREFLSDSQQANAADVDRFIEAAVKRALLQKVVTRIQEAAAPHFAHLSEDELMDEITAVVDEVRADMRAGK